MDQNQDVSNSSHRIEVGRKSWTAYLRVVVLGLLLLLIVVPLIWRASVVAGLVALGLVVLYIAYRVAMIRSWQIFYDDAGVWVFRGVLPWNRGISGVKWRDLDEAVYIQTFWSWAFKSYSVRIAHRFTKSSEINVDHIARGNDSVVMINTMHQHLVREKAIA
jgi:hypothetical protein